MAYRHQVRRIVLTLLAAGLAAPGCAAPAGDPVLQGGHEAWFLETAVRAASQADCPGVAVDGIRLERDRARIALTHASGRSEVRLVHSSVRCGDCMAARDFAVAYDAADACGRSYAAALQRDIESGDPPDAWAFAGKPPFATGAGVWLFLAAWLALGAMALALACRHAGRDLALLGLAALGIRLALATWGPGDLQLNLHADKAEVYGAAPYAVTWFLDRVLRPADLVPVLVGTSAFLGSVAVVLVALFLREAGAPRRVALAAAVLMALHPVAIRFSGDCERQMYLLVAQLAAFLAVAAAQARHRWWPLAGFVLGGALATLSRPEGVLVWPSAVFLALLLPLSRKTIVVAAVGVAGFAVGLPRMLVDFGVNVDVARTTLDIRGLMFADPRFTPLAVTALFLAGAVLALKARNRLFAGLALLAVGSATPGLIYPTSDFVIANARYQLQALVPFLSVAAFGLVIATDRLRDARPGRPSAWSGPVAWALVAVTALPPLVLVTRRVTIDHEFALLRRVLPRLPRDAIVYVSHPDGRIMDTAGFRSMDALADWVGREDLEWRLWGDAAPRGDSPAFFYRQPACGLPRFTFGDAPPGDPVYECIPCVVDRCEEGTAAGVGPPVVEVTLPALPFSTERFAAPGLRVGIYPLAP